MRALARFGCLVALGCSVHTGLAAELEGSRFNPTGARLAPLASIQARAQLRGMHVRNVRWDSVLRQNWAVLEDVQHPERPLWAELVGTPGLLPGDSGADPNGNGEAPPAYVAPKPVIAVVHYGDRVRLWRTERNVRIEMSAVTEASAAVGDEVKLKIVGSGTDGDAGWQVTGIVRGPGDVEME